MEEQDSAPSLKVKLVEGLSIDQLEEKLDLAFRGGDVYHRMQAFYLVELECTRGYQILGHPSAVHFACTR